MPLKLTIISYQRLSPGQETTKVLDRGSVSIGRAAQNDWILQDPERILSGKHCTVHHQDGGYFLTDTSTNGVYLNDSEQRIGRGEMVRLQEGDRFVLGEYEIAATLLPSATEWDENEAAGPITDVVVVPTMAAVSAFPTAGVVSLDSHAADIPKHSFADIFAEDHDDLGLPPPPAVGVIATEPSPDLMAPDRAFFEPPALISETPAALPESRSAAQREISDQMDHAVEPVASAPAVAVSEAVLLSPTAAPETPEPDAFPAAKISEGPVIPEDWWMAPPTAAAAVQQVAEPLPHQPIAVEPPPLVPQPAAAPLLQESAKPVLPISPKPAVVVEALSIPAVAELPVRPDDKRLLHAFLEGAGLPQVRLSDEQLPEVMANLGAIFRATVQGMMEILLARGDVKGEFRLDRTNIGPIENNPLKTPPGQPPLSPEEVMTLLLIRRKDAYMSPVQAVCEGFNDIKAHQLAVMAGIQAALNRLLERFDPSNLETRLQQTVLDSILPANRKAKYWDLFTAEYRAIAHEAEEDFNELFGDEFARAYQERLRTHY